MLRPTNNTTAVQVGGARKRRPAVAACAGLALGSLVGCGTTKPLAITKPRSPGQVSAGAIGDSPGAPVPSGFAAVSASFVSPDTGWALGSAPCPGGSCAAVLRTPDGGRSWAVVAAPRIDQTDTSTGGVSRIRFADGDNGWAFGPGLWATHDGGATWSRVALPGEANGATVAELAASAGGVHVAVVEGDGVHVLSSPVGREAWTTSPTTVPLGNGPSLEAQLVATGGSGWLIVTNGSVIGGARLSAGAWAPWQPPCADAGGRASLAAATVTDLVAICEEGATTGTTQAVRSFASSDGGATFHPSGVALPLSCCAAVASATPGVAVVADDGGDGPAGLLADFQDGAGWAGVYTGRAGQSWHDLSFLSRTQGVVVAVSTEPPAASLLVTTDGGHTWKATPIR